MDKTFPPSFLESITLVCLRVFFLLLELQLVSALILSVFPFYIFKFTSLNVVYINK